MSDELNMEGSYEITLLEDGIQIARYALPNTITTVGKTLMLNYISGGLSTFLNYIGLGLGTTAATTGDTDLYHEIFRKAIESATYDTTNSKVSWHISLSPLEAVGVLGEIGMFDRTKNDDDDTFNDRLLSKFDETTWTAGAGDTTNFIEGEKALKVTTSGTTSTLLTKSMDLSGYQASDTFSILVYPYSIAGLTNIILTFETDASNYYYYTFTSFSATAWNQKTATKTSFSTSGNPDWSNITKIKLTITASGSIDITFGSLRSIVKSNILSTLFSRRVISPAVTKTSKQEMLVTYSITYT